MAFVRIGGQLLHYRLEGPRDGKVLAFLNSLGTDYRIWDAVAARLAGRYRLLRYDQRGHGLSDAPAGDYRLGDAVADLDGLLTHAGIDKAVLIGVSVGGLIAQGFALAHPKRLAGLVLMDTAATIGDAALWNARIEAVTTSGIASISDRILDRWFDAEYRRQHPDDFAGWRNMLERMPPAGYAGTCALLRETDLREAVGGIGLTSLVLVGEKDASMPPELAHETAVRLPGARFELIARAGHLPNIEQPEAVVVALDRYLMEVGFV